MEAPKILKYTFSLVFAFAVVHSAAQKTEWQGLSLGFDLSRAAMPLADSTRLGWEASADYELIPNMYCVAELGSQTTRFDDENYDYYSFGAYTRVGVDYNFMKHVDETSEDKLFIGLRYAFTTFSHKADNVSVVDDVWGTYSGGSIPSSWMGANWLEITLGMRARIVNNFYVGWSARSKIMIWESDYGLLQPYYIPGYGRGYKSSSIGITYSIYYMIPIKKKKMVAEEKKPGS